MTDIVLLAVIALIVGGAGVYIYKAKKRGAKCIGCPNGGKGCSCGCSGCTRADCPSHKDP